jgi:hypothetical protein
MIAVIGQTLDDVAYGLARAMLDGEPGAEEIFADWVEEMGWRPSKEVMITAANCVTWIQSSRLEARELDRLTMLFDRLHGVLWYERWQVRIVLRTFVIQYKAKHTQPRRIRT